MSVVNVKLLVISFSKFSSIGTPHFMGIRPSLISKEVFWERENTSIDNAE